MPLWLQATILFCAALVLFRIGGKESISSMRIPEVVVMIGLASILVEPIKSKNVWTSIYAAGVFIILSLIVNYAPIYLPKTKKWIIGQPIFLIKNGEIIYPNLKRSRITEDDLKMQLRAEKVNDIKIVKSAVLEASGRLGIELYPEHAVATKKDIDELKQAIQLIGEKLHVSPSFSASKPAQSSNLFTQAEQVQAQDPLQ